MRPYLAMLRARFRTLLQYRAASLAGFGTQLFWGLIRVMIFEAFYRSSTAPQPMSLENTVTYLWLTQAMFHLLPYRLDGDVMQMVRDGTVVYELARPVDLYWSWLSRTMAMRTAPTLLRAAPLVAIAVPFFGMRLPPSWASFAAFRGLHGGCRAGTSTVSTLAGITLLWTISARALAPCCRSLSCSCQLLRALATLPSLGAEGSWPCCLRGNHWTCPSASGPATFRRPPGTAAHLAAGAVVGRLGPGGAVAIGAGHTPPSWYRGADG